MIIEIEGIATIPTSVESQIIIATDGDVMTDSAKVERRECTALLARGTGTDGHM